LEPDGLFRADDVLDQKSGRELWEAAAAAAAVFSSVACFFLNASLSVIFTFSHLLFQLIGTLSLHLLSLASSSTVSEHITD